MEIVVEVGVHAKGVDRMKKHLPTKAETAMLEPFEGLALERIVVPKTAEEFAAATAEIFAAGVAGFDTESKPLFNKGDVSQGPHVVQFALRDKAFIFQLHHPVCLPFLKELLQSEQLLKVGFGLQSDHGHIQSRLGVALGAVLDLNNVFRTDGFGSSIGVRTAVAIVFNRYFRKSKSVTTSNWASPGLSPKQLMYAANDAYAALCVLNALDRPRVDLPITGLTPDSGTP